MSTPEKGPAVLQTYGKSIIAFVYAAVMAVIPQVSGDGRLDPSELVTIAIAVATAAGVYLIPLAPSARWTKTALGILLAVLNVLTTVVLDHRVDAEEIAMILTALVAAAGIAVAPATSTATGASVKWGADR